MEEQSQELLAHRPFHTRPPKDQIVQNLCFSAILLNIPYYTSYLCLLFSKVIINAYVNSNRENVNESSKGNLLLNTFCIVTVQGMTSLSLEQAFPVV